MGRQRSLRLRSRAYPEMSRLFDDVRSVLRCHKPDTPRLPDKPPARDLLDLATREALAACERPRHALGHA